MRPSSRAVSKQHWRSVSCCTLQCVGTLKQFCGLARRLLQLSKQVSESSGASQAKRCTSQVGDDQWAALRLDELADTVDRHHRNLNRDVVGVTHAGMISHMDGRVLAGIVLAGIDARERQYHRDFRARPRLQGQFF